MLPGHLLTAHAFTDSSGAEYPLFITCRLLALGHVSGQPGLSPQHDMTVVLLDSAHLVH